MYLDSHNWSVTAIGHLCNAIGAWLRYAAVIRGDYGIAQLSSIVIGFTGAVIISSYAQIAERWFPEKERTLAITIGVQCNYAGWCVGGLVIPNLCAMGEESGGWFGCSVTKPQLETLLLIQGFLVTASLVLFGLFHRSKPSLLREEGSNTRLVGSFLEAPDADRECRQERQEAPAWGSVKCLLGNGRFMVMLFSYSLLGGVSFAIPGVQSGVFTTMGLDNAQSSLTNTAFILAGVLTGLGMGFGLSSKEHNRRIIISLFGLCAVSLLAMTVVAALDLEKHGGNKTLLLVFYILMMALSGAASLGFIGLALSRSVEQGFLVPFQQGDVVWEVSESTRRGRWSGLSRSGGL